MAKDLSLKILINAQATGSGFSQTQQGLASITQQLEGVKARLSGLLGLSVADILFGKAADLIKTADSYKTLEARLKLVSDNTKEFATAQTALFDIAQRSRGSLEGTYTLYGKLETAIKSMGGTQQQALQTTETMNQAIALTSQGMEQDKDVVLQFSQALASGVLRGDEFNSVMEASPGLAQALAEGLGVTTGQLRGMAEAGQLTSDKLINALGKVAPSVAEKFNQLPLTVGQAMTQLNNAFTVFVGNTDKANGASAKLAGVISGVANNFTTIANAVLVLAELYGAKLVLGLSASTKAFIENTLAVKQKALADQQAAAAAVAAFPLEIRRAEVEVAHNLNLIKEAQLQRALATTEVQRAQALRVLDSAYNKLAASEAMLHTKTAALAAVSKTATSGVGLLAGAFRLLNGGIVLLAGYEIAKMLAEWAMKFEEVRRIVSDLSAGVATLMSYLGQVAAIIQAGFGGASMSKDGTSEIDKINEKYAAFREQIVQWAIAGRQSNALFAGSVEEANNKIQTSLKATGDAYKTFFTNLEAGYQHEVELVNQREQQQTLDLERSVTDEQERARQQTDIVVKSSEERLRIAKNYYAAQESEIGKQRVQEIADARGTADVLAGIETTTLAKRLENLKVYEAALKANIASLIAEEQHHTEAARALDEQRKNSFISTEEAILGFLRESMDEQQKVRSLINEQEDLQSALRKAQAEGDFKEQERIAEKLKTLAFERGHAERQIAEENGDAVTGANNRAVESYRAAAQAGQDALRGMQTAEEAAAGKARAAADAATLSLQKVEADIGKLQAELGKDTTSKHIVTSNVADVLKEILSLNNQNTESTHTVKTEQARQNGGPILRLNSGGKLSGYGGGDTVPAMLEPGEFVVRKEAVDKYGAGLFAKLNAMNVSAGDVVKRRFGGIIPGFAVGGSVGADSVDKEKERRKLHLDASAAEIVKQKAEKEQLKGEIDAIKAKIISLAGQAQVSTVGGYQRAHSSDSTLDQLIAGASKAAFSKGGAGSYLDSVTASLQLFVKRLHQTKKKFEDLAVQGAKNFSVNLAPNTGGVKIDAHPMATGGSVPGVGNTDSVPAMLTPGEWVINKASVAKFGNAFMDSVNRGVLPQGFNSGGQVGAASGGGNVVVQFKAPDGQTAQAAFGNQSDVNQFLEVIRLSGGVTA